MSNKAQDKPVIFRGSVRNRRLFLKRSVLSAMATALGTPIVQAAKLPAGYTPLAFTIKSNPMDGKDEAMIVRNDRPWNVEAPPH